MATRFVKVAIVMTIPVNVPEGFDPNRQKDFRELDQAVSEVYRRVADTLTDPERMQGYILSRADVDYYRVVDLEKDGQWDTDEEFLDLVKEFSEDSVEKVSPVRQKVW